MSTSRKKSMGISKAGLSALVAKANYFEGDNLNFEE